MLPGARVVMTPWPNDNIPSTVFQHTADLYGFSQESIKKYITKFSRENVELQQFITSYLPNNVNIATLC